MAKAKGPAIPVPRDVKPRYLSMGSWKSKQIDKKNKGSRTTSGVARTYIAYPPADGWKGGDPRLNGLGAGKSGKK